MLFGRVYERQLVGPKLHKKTGTAPLALTVLASFIWGSSFVAIKIGLGSLDPFWFVTLRMCVATLFSGAIVLVVRRKLDKDTFNNWQPYALGVLNGLGFILQFLGMTLTTASKAALLVNINVVPIAILSSYFLNEKLAGAKWLAIGVGSAGIFLLSTGGDIASIASGAFLGDMIVFSGGFVWSFYVVLQKKTVTEKEPDLLQASFIIMGVTALTTLIPSVALQRAIVLEPVGIVSIIYLGIFATTVAYIIWAYALRSISATASSIILLLEIFFAVLLASALLAETLSPLNIIGGMLVVISVILVSFDLTGSRASLKAIFS